MNIEISHLSEAQLKESISYSLAALESVLIKEGRPLTVEEYNHLHGIWITLLKIFNPKDYR